MERNLDAIIDAELDAWEEDDDDDNDNNNQHGDGVVTETKKYYVPTISTPVSKATKLNDASKVEPSSDTDRKPAATPIVSNNTVKESSVPLGGMQNLTLNSNEMKSTTTTTKNSNTTIKETKKKKTNTTAKSKDSTGKKKGGENNAQANADQMLESMLNDFESSFSNKHDFDQVMEGMMEQIMSKELMYEPMKSVTELYPKWLAENKDKISQEDYQRYGTQYQYFQRVVHLYDTEPGNFPKLLELMQDMQEYGHPPTEIMKEIAPEMPLDEDGMPSTLGEGADGFPPFPPFMNMPPNIAGGNSGFDGNPEDCSIM